MLQTVSNIKLDDVVSDISDKAASAIMAILLANNESFEATPHLTKGIKAPVEKIQAAACLVCSFCYQGQAIP